MRGHLPLASIALCLCAAAVFAVRDSAEPATPQAPSPAPLFFNEISDWCAGGCVGRFEDLGNGYVRFVLNAESDGGLDGVCSELTIPEGVEGWAYVQTVDNSLPERPTYPAGASQTEMRSIDATWVARVPILEDFAVIPIEESRSQLYPYCEIVARRVP